MSKSKKAKKPLFTKKQLEAGFTMPTARHMLPEDITVHSIHVSIEEDSNGLKTVYDSHTNTTWKVSRASLAAFGMAMNDGEHHAALRTPLD